MVRVNLLRAHGGPAQYMYSSHGCRCCPCRRAQSAYQSAYYARWRARKLALSAKHYAANRSDIRARRDEYFAKNKDAEIAKRRVYGATHREEERVRQQVRRARKIGSLSCYTCADIRAQKNRQKGRCFWCSETLNNKYHIDHVTPLCLGGSNGVENIVVSCPRCNMAKHTRHPMDWAGILL